MPLATHRTWIRIRRQKAATAIIAVLATIPALVLSPASATANATAPIEVVVLDSQGTYDLEQTIWEDLNLGWAGLGETPVNIDFTTFRRFDLVESVDFSYDDIAATGADVVVVSNASPWFFEFTASEAEAIFRYVSEGHGIIVTYHSFGGANSGLAPLLGLDESIALETNAFGSIDFFQSQSHPVLEGVSNPYSTGVPYMATPGLPPAAWPVTTGEVIASTIATSGPVDKEGVIVAHDAGVYRGVYFSHYIEDASAGSNSDDIQVFYNALVWAGAPPPSPLSCTIVGTSGNDVLVGTSGDDVICGRGGDDIIYGNEGADVLRGGGGNDRIYGGWGKDSIKGNAGNDRLVGGGGGDTIIGGPGDDVLRGKGGNDRLEGNRGNDSLFGGRGTDSCSGGAGSDTLVSCE